MKIRAIIPNEPGHASNWWRIIKPFEFLQRRGIDATWHYFDNLQAVDMQNALVVIHRIIPADPHTYINQLYARGAKSIIYSIDDYTTNKEALEEYLTRSGGLTSLALEKIIGRVDQEIATINLCEDLLVSTEELANLVQDDVHTPSSVIENYIDIDWYTDALSKTPSYIANGDLVHIGYASGRRPGLDLEPMATAWGRLDNEFPNVRFVVAGWQPDIIDRNINLDKKIRLDWAPLDKWPQSMQVDIGCCALADIPFNNGKSPIKFYEYTIAGAAVVASSNVTVYEYVMTDFVTGYLASNEDEWYKTLRNLVTMSSYRKTMQESAQYYVTRNKSLDKNIIKWIEYLERLI